MTITIVGPDQSKFNFPDDTPPDTISSAMAQQYPGQQQAAGPPPSGQDVSAIAAAQHLPVVGPYAAPAAAWLRTKASGGTQAENLAQIQSDISDYERRKPIQSALGGAVIGTLPYLVAGEFAGPARLLGMAGPARTAIPVAAGTGALIGGMDASARGQSPGWGMAEGALGGAGGVVLGKAAGRVWDAARGLWVDRPRIPYTMNVGSDQIPVSEGIATRNPATQAEEQRMLNTQQPDAVAADQRTKAAMDQTHANVTASLDPTGQSLGSTSLDAGVQASQDLQQLEAQRLQAEQNRVAQARAGMQQTISDVGAPPPAPLPSAGAPASQPLVGAPPAVPPLSTSPLDVGSRISQGIGDLFRTARAATNAAYRRFRSAPGAYDPSQLVGVGNDIRTALSRAPGTERVSLAPDRTPMGMNALNMIDSEVGQLQFTNAARDPTVPPPRPITADDMNDILKNLVIYRRQANAAARQSGYWGDAHAVGRITDEFQDWLARKTMQPGVFSGNPTEVLDALNAARGAHAQERATFSRRGAGDVVGQFMENVIGKFPGQQMQPEKIVKTLFGSPDNPFASNAVPILTHLRDKVFGANSQEWADIQSGILRHITEPPAGVMEPISLEQQAQRVEKLLSHRQLADVLFSPQVQAQLRIQAADMRAAHPQAMPAATTMEGKVARLAGRGGGMPASPEHIISLLRGADGAAYAQEFEKVLPQQTWARIKQGLLQDVIQEKGGAIPWGDQKIGNRLANWMSTHAFQQIYSPAEQAVIGQLRDAHIGLVPIPRATQPSKAAYELARMGKAMFGQAMNIIGLVHGGIGGAIRNALIAKGAETYATAKTAMRAKDLFYGPRAALPRQGSYYPGRFGALGGHALAHQISDQSSPQ